MRKPSDLKIYVDNKIKEIAEEYTILETEIAEATIKDTTQDYNEKKKKLLAQMDILLTVKKICDTRKKY